MILREITHALAAELQDAQIPDAGFEAGCMTASVCGADYRQKPEQAVSETEAEALHALCKKRMNGRPLQYLLGEWEFYGLPFFVGDGVLIPRQDTETLADYALRLLQPIAAPRVLDLCSGSGCLAITMQHARPDAAVTAIEREAKALSYLRRNAARNRTAITIIEGDVLDPALAASFADYDLILCNPPYLTAEDLRCLQREVAFEPRTALDGGEDGLLFYRQLPVLWRTALHTGGTLAFEIGMGQETAVSAFLTDAGYAAPVQIPDLTEKIRVVAATRM